MIFRESAKLEDKLHHKKLIFIKSGGNACN